MNELARVDLSAAVPVAQLDPVLDSVSIQITEFGRPEVVLRSDCDAERRRDNYVRPSRDELRVQVVEEALVADIQDCFKWLLLQDKSFLIVCVELYLLNFLHAKLAFQLVRLER